MKLHYLATAVSLATRVAAGGYHGCLERVALWQAYTLEGKSGAKGPVIGYHCPEFQRRTGCPEDGWHICGNVPGQRCTFSQFMKQLNPESYDEKALNWLVTDPQRQKRIGVKKLANNCYNYFREREASVPDFIPQNAMKVTSGNFGEYVVALGRRMNTLRGSLMPVDRAKQMLEYKSFTENSQTIVNIRRGDIGDYLLEATRLNLGPEITVVPLELGKHPLFGRDMVTVDWIATEARADKDGVEYYKNKIKRFKQTCFAAGTDAGNHQHIDRQYAEVEKERNACGRK